jgi:polyisoprenoid-binding protein YceI
MPRRRRIFFRRRPAPTRSTKRTPAWCCASIISVCRNIRCALPATLDFDPADLARSRVKATVDARSIETDFPEPERLDFDAQLQSAQWLDTARFPEMRYASTRVQLIGPNRLRIDGDLTLHGVTRPVPLEAAFNGGFARHPLGGNAQIGFSATGSLKRSDFGILFALPPPHSTFGVGDDIDFALELEFSKPNPATP